MTCYNLYDKAQSYFSACTTRITFDDIPGQSSTSGVIPNGYKNLNWVNAEYVNISTMPSNSGYGRKYGDSPFVMHNPTGEMINITTANGSRFSYDSIRITSAWRDSLNVTVRAPSYQVALISLKILSCQIKSGHLHL